MSIPGSATPLLLATTAAEAAAAYQVDRSLRFNSADSAYLSRTPSSAGNRKTWTWSGWVKRARLGTEETLFSCGTSTSNTTFGQIIFSNTDTLRFNAYSITWRDTSQVFRDLSAWYHIVIALDTTQSTANDRVKVYVNGQQVTSFGISSDPTQNTDYAINQNIQHTIGRYDLGGGGNYLSDYLADVHFIDGQALDPTDFGEYDSDNNWNPKAYSGTYGTNGFHLDFSDNSSNAALGDDSSGNNNDWTVNNLVAVTGGTADAVDFTSSSTRLNLASSSDFNLNSSNWTIEFFFINRSTAVQRFYYFGDNSQNLQTATNGTQLLYYNGSTAFTFGSVSLNKLHHVALVNSGGTVTAYIDGSSVTTFSAGSSSTRTLTIGAFSDGTNALNGIISNFRIVNGSSVYSSNFSILTTNLSNVTNTVLLCCQSSSSVTDATVAPGSITASGTPTVTTVTSPSTADQDSLIDTPTNYEASSGNNGGNYATLNPLEAGSGFALSNGNLDASVSSGWRSALGTLAIDAGKWYYEFELSAGTAQVGICGSGTSRLGTYIQTDATAYIVQTNTGTFYTGSSGSVSSGFTWSAGDIVQIAYDGTNNKIWVGKNNSWYGDPSAGTGEISSSAGPGSTRRATLPVVSLDNSSSGVVNFGQRPFAYTPPTGYKSLCTQNLPDPTIADGSTAFDAVLYTGNGSTQSITGLGFSPDFVWTKQRNTARNHGLYDIVRGATKRLTSNGTNAEITDANLLTSFDSNGFSVGNDSEVNESSGTYVGWAWDAGTSTATNTDGSITSNVRANQSAGFSIVSYTGNGSSSATVGHGLNASLGMIIHKNRDAAANWNIKHSSLASNHGLAFTTTQSQDVTTAYSGGGFANLTSNSTFAFLSGTSNANNVNENGVDYIAYCFAPVAGYSAFGSYTGNGSSNGPFVYTGFRPRWILTKRYDGGSNGWGIFDALRPGYNLTDSFLQAQSNGAESTGATAYSIDILSNGFKVKGTDAFVNQSGGTYLYACFAEHPLKTARAR